MEIRSDGFPQPIYVGCAGWSIRREHADLFAGAGTHLQRYARRFSAVEINSSFYRPHQRKTYTRWGESVPEGFRFSAKLPKSITHQSRLVAADEQLQRFLHEVSGLGEKLGALLVQLPPTLQYDPLTADPFFEGLHQRAAAAIVCEPRHPSWFTAQVEQLFQRLAVARAVVDPPPVAAAAEPIGTSSLQYFRLHGSPKMYYSTYDQPYLQRLSERLAQLKPAGTVWCIFDNTAEGGAVTNALTIEQLLRQVGIQFTGAPAGV